MKFSGVEGEYFADFPDAPEPKKSRGHSKPRTPRAEHLPRVAYEPEVIAEHLPNNGSAIRGQNVSFLPDAMHFLGSAMHMMGDGIGTGARAVADTAIDAAGVAKDHPLVTTTAVVAGGGRGLFSRAVAPLRHVIVNRILKYPLGAYEFVMWNLAALGQRREED